MMNALKNMFGKKTQKVSTYGQVESLLVNLSGDIVG